MTKKASGTSVENTFSLKSLSVRFLFFLAFIEGSFVVFCEMVGAKMLSAFFGNSLSVWTAVISVTISCLALGYYVGGVLSRKTNKLTILSYLFAVAGWLMVVMPSWSKHLFQYFIDTELVIGAILSAIFLIGPAIFCLGATTPIIIQLINNNYNEAGKSAGHAYAVSTIAGIVSTLVLGFLLLPNWGKEVPLFIASALLVVLSFRIRFQYLSLFTAAVLFISLVSFLRQETTIPFSKKMYNSEGVMGRLTVYEQSYIDSPMRFRTLFVNGVPQTIIYSHEHRSNSFWDYVHKMSATASMKNGGDALLIGMGGGAVANELQELNFKLDIVDIDKRMFDISQRFFFFTPLITTSFIENDARNFIKTCKKTYDVIIIDVASGEVQPSNVFTVEGVLELKQLLKPNGFVLIQYQEKINPEKLSGHLCIAKTFQENDFNIYANYDYSEIAGIVLFCSLNKIDVIPVIEKENLTNNVISQPWLGQFLDESYIPINVSLGKGVLLTDDQPRLEQINYQTIEEWRKMAIKNFGHLFMN
jgi:predicted membrane-bound spermidine synthase